jgi:hypothetical protein
MMATYCVSPCKWQSERTLTDCDCVDEDDALAVGSGDREVKGAVPKLVDEIV